MSKISRFANLMGFPVGTKKAGEENKDTDNCEKPVRKDGESDEDYEKRVKEWEDEQDDDESAENPKETDPNDADKEKAAHAAGHAEGFKAGNARWATVLSSKAAEGRVVTACNLLADTDLSAEQIQKTLATLPAEKAPRATLNDRTGGRSTPAPAADGGNAAAEPSKGQRIIAARDRRLAPTNAAA